MDKNVAPSRSCLKRKLSTDEKLTCATDAKRSLKNPVKEISLFESTQSSDLPRRKSNVSSIQPTSAQSRLRKVPLKDYIQTRFRGISSKQLKNDTNSIQDSTIGSSNKTSCSPPEVGHRYSAQNRLQLLRNKIATKNTSQSSFSSDTPKLDGSQARITLDKSSESDKSYLKRNRIVTDKLPGISLAARNSYQPFKPITSSSSKTQNDDIVLTDYDDSDSAAEFGNDTTDSSPNSSNRYNGGSHVAYIKQQVDKLNGSSGSSINNRIKNNQHSVLNASDKSHTSVVCTNRQLPNTKLFSSEKQFECRSETKVPGFLVNKKAAASKFQNDRRINTRLKPYSANDRLKNIQTQAVTLNTNNLGHSQQKPLVEIPGLLVRSRTVHPANTDSSSSDNVISNLSYHNNSEQESLTNQEQLLPKRSSLLSERLSNIRNSALNKSTLNSENVLPLHKDTSQVNENSFLNVNFSNLQPLSNLLSVNNHITPEPQINWRINSDSTLPFPRISLPNDCSIEEPMDWSNIDENETLSNLQVLRKTVIDTEEITHIPQTPFQEIVAKTFPEMPQNMTILKEIYVVVDTNIFISHLHIVKKVLDVKINETPIIMIPWMVIQELDYIKDGRSGEKLKGKAQEAIRFINHKLSRKDPYVKGQSVLDAASQDFSSKNPDDGILHCCLQIIKKGNKATLLSNDVNLRNKALVHSFPAYGHDKIISALDPYHTKRAENTMCRISKEDDRIRELKLYLSETCSYIIAEILKQDYGAIWEYIKPTNPPWSLQKCIELFIEYWMPVFSNYLNKQCAKLLDDFGEYLKTKHDGIIPIEDGENLIEFSLALCVFLKNGLPNFRNTVDLCINNLQNIVL